MRNKAHERREIIFEWSAKKEDKRVRYGRLHAETIMNILTS
jgi:hypothetical protein